MNIRSITILLIISLLVIPILVVGCGGSGDATEELAQTPSQTEQDGIDTIAEQDIHQGIVELESQLQDCSSCRGGALKTSDTDYDGTDDKWTFTFGRKEIEEGLFEEVNLDFQAIGSETIQGMVTVKLENTGDKDYLDYEYIFEIPKSFAASIDDLELSVPPDQVIDPDPKWIIKTDLLTHTVRQMSVGAIIKQAEKEPWEDVKKRITDFAKIDCGKEKDKKKRDYCFLDLAMIGKVPSLCDQIGMVKHDFEDYGTALHDICYMVLAKELNDPSLCDRIGQNTSLYKDVHPQSVIDLLKRQCMGNLLGPTKMNIQVPTGPLRMGEEITFKAVPQGVLPENPYYEWDFDDSSGIGIPFSNEATHLYESEGSYTIEVSLYDKEGGKLLTTASTTVTIEHQGMSILQAYQNVKHIDVSIHTWLLWRYEEGKKPDGASDVTFGDDSTGHRATTVKGEIQWTGTIFEIKASDSAFKCTGEISEDGNELLYLEVSNNWDMGTRGSASYTLRNIPLTASGIKGPPHSIELDNQFGYYSFEFSASGSGVKDYVGHQSHHVEYGSGEKVVARNFDSWDPERADDHSLEIKFYVTQGD